MNFFYRQFHMPRLIIEIEINALKKGTKIYLTVLWYLIVYNSVINPGFIPVEY